MTEKPMVLESKINIPFAYAAGEVASHFLIALRDEKKILGRSCLKCRKVFCPPESICSFCFAKTDRWVELSGEGTLESFAVIHRALPYLPFPPPLIYGIFHLLGSDTNLVHLLGEIEVRDIEIGMKVTPVFAEIRSGSILDIAYFKPV